MGIIYFWQCCLFVFDFRPLTSFLLSNWVCACPVVPLLWWWLGPQDPGCAPAVHISSLQAARHSSSSSACSTPSLSPAHGTWTSFWPSWPWSWSVPWRACLCTQVSMTRSLLILRKIFNCRLHPHLKSGSFTFLSGKLFYMAETLLSTHVSHCWPHPNSSNFKPLGTYQRVIFLNLCHQQILIK